MKGWPAARVRGRAYAGRECGDVKEREGHRQHGAPFAAQVGVDAAGRAKAVPPRHRVTRARNSFGTCPAPAGVRAGVGEHLLRMATIGAGTEKALGKAE